jgi:uncharacterized protein YndB with AHSA1/START domain
MTDDDPSTIQVDDFLPHAPERVWAALTDPDLLGRWLMDNDFEATVGHRFTFRTDPRPGFDGIVHCQVLDLEPPRRLRISWAGGGIDTTVTWTVVPEGHGTRLFLEHAGFDPDDAGQQQVRRILGSGWRSHVLRRIEAVLI